MSQTVPDECRWHFSPQNGGVDRGPNDAKGTIFVKTPYKSLVRESIQNSLDAAIDDTNPVRVAFRFGKIPKSAAGSFFELREHILGCADYFSENQRAGEKYQAMADRFASLGQDEDSIEYLEISDSSTRGMEYTPGSTSSPFYAFMRSEGVSSKGTNRTGGSFGIGKAAYFEISPISTLIVSTLTDSGKHVFEGAARLCTHSFRGQTLCDVGFFDNNNGVPVTEADKIPPMFLRHEPGTSIYIVGLRDESKDQSESTGQIISETLRNFWYAIMSGRLVVTVGNEEISKNTLDKLMNATFTDEQDSRRSGEDYNPLPYYRAVSEIVSKGDEAGEIASRLYKINDDLATLGKVSLYLARVKGARDKIIYMRAPQMTVYRKSTSTNYGLYGVFVCENPKGDAILQSMENPAHNEWNKNNCAYGDTAKKDRARAAETEIKDFVKNTLERLFAGDPSRDLDISGLSDYLYVPDNLLEKENGGQALQENDIVNIKNEITTDPVEKKAPDKTSAASIILTSQGRHDPSKPERPDQGPPTGQYTHKSKKTRTKGSNSTAGQNPGQQPNSPEGTHQTYVPVRFRSYVQETDNRFIHKLIIDTDTDIQNGSIEIITNSEQGDEKVPIKSSTIGKCSGTWIEKLSLKKGKNTLEIEFEDNLPHALKVWAYENS